MATVKNEITIIKPDLRDGYFGNYRHEIMYKRELSSDSRLLLIHLLNLPKDWDLKFYKVAELFGWTKKRLTKAKKELELFNHLTSVRIKNTSGYHFKYTIIALPLNLQ
jgi:hypothetical protein